MEKERERRLRPKHREFIRRVKSRSGCKKCGYNKSLRALHFHHVNPEDKFRPGQAAVKPHWSITKIKREIRKCIILCANCHAEEHDADRV